MPGVYKVALGVFAVLVAVIAIVYFVFFAGGGDGDQQLEALAEPTPTVVPTATPTLSEQLTARLTGVTLNSSDFAIRELVAELSARPELAAWLVNDDLVRRFTAAAHNVAAGKSPVEQFEFLRPEEPFLAKERQGTFTIDSASYDRYDAVVSVVTSLDTEGTVALYREMQPLIVEAHREIAPPGQDFDAQLIQAIDHLLRTPILRSEPELTEKVVTYAFTDPDVENLSAAQRQLLRMGPENVRAIQNKLRAIKDELLRVPLEE